jgi:hypothetical protein
VSPAESCVLIGCYGYETLCELGNGCGFGTSCAEAAQCRVLNSWCGQAPSNLMCFFLSA